ncbi:hypothetical protein GCM10009789_26010 [Kribbella sancticallisti]|uniref:Phage integrase family protein n=1 Tax=Kribbella sancticallisti TaxID=460087 RepID=A0ABN2D670_9ACTN
MKILFRWYNDRNIRASSYNSRIWYPALAHAGVIPQPTRNARGALHYLTDRETGMHALRHYYASVALADGVNIKELAEYLGHSDPGFTLRLTPTCSRPHTTAPERQSTRGSAESSRWRLRRPTATSPQPGRH